MKHEYPPTKRQKDLLIALDKLIAANGGISPTNQELAAAMGISDGAVSMLIRRLIARGQVRRLPNTARTLQPVREGEAA